MRERYVRAVRLRRTARTYLSLFVSREAGRIQKNLHVALSKKVGYSRVNAAGLLFVSATLYNEASKAGLKGAATPSQIEAGIF